MTDQFAIKASLQSSEELQNRIATREKYLPETTEASVAELRKRGHVFSDEELEVINQDLTAQRENAASSGDGSAGLFNSNYKYCLVEDLDAPVLYSRRAIYVFTVFFGALFGSIMLAINSAKVKNTKGVYIALVFGIGITVLQIWIGEVINAGSSFGIFCGITSALLIHYLLWNPLIGKSTFYKAKPIWIPSIIGVLLAALIVALVIIASQAQP